MPETPNHGYNVPDEGEQNWHEPLNENFEQYDTDIEIRDKRANLGDYDPKAGAKFLATDTGYTFLADGSSWVPLPYTGENPTVQDLRVKQELLCDGPAAVDNHLTVGGQNNWNLDNTDGDFEIGNGNYLLAIGVALGGGGAGACNIRAKGGIQQLQLGAGSNGHTLRIQPDKASVNGDFEVSGTKNFVQSVDTDDGEKEVVYTATEAGTPHTEVSGVAELSDGRAAVELPEHFGWVTDSDEPLHVQTTPYAVESSGLAVVERSRERLVVEDLDGAGDYEFAYTVKGTREGHADQRVVREPSAEASADPAPADD